MRLELWWEKLLMIVFLSLTSSCTRQTNSWLRAGSPTTRVFFFVCFFSEWRVPTNLSSLGQSCLSILRSPTRWRRADYLRGVPRSSSASCTCFLCLTHWSFTLPLPPVHWQRYTHARTQAGVRSVIPLRALQRHYGGPEALERIIVQMRTHILVSLELSWTTAGRVWGSQVVF